jgi:hypothetical protein
MIPFLFIVFLIFMLVHCESIAMVVILAVYTIFLTGLFVWGFLNGVKNKKD